MSENQAVYLANAAARFPSSGNLCHLKSHFLWICSVSGGRDVPMTSVMCSKCCQVWSNGKFSIKLKSASIGPRMLKILKKVETSQKLNRVETSLLKRCRQNNRNKMVLTCMKCKGETVMQFKKPVVEKPDQTKTPTLDLHTPASSKRKRKDRFAGLNVSAVMSATPSTPFFSIKSSKRINKLAHSGTPVASTRQLHTVTPRGISNRTNSTPNISRDQPEPIRIKAGPISAKQKMNVLREEVKQAEQDRLREEKKALTTRNLNVRRNDKLQMFLSKTEKDIKPEDRINSLLQH